MERHTLVKRLSVRAGMNFSSGSIDLYVIDRLEHEPGAIARPTATMPFDVAQELIDDLWRAGIRPTEGKVSDKTLEAKDENLGDLRRILNIVLPSALHGGK